MKIDPINSLKDLLIGPPLPTKRLAEERLNKVQALAAFLPDALSSIAYANQETYLGMVVAGATGLPVSPKPLPAPRSVLPISGVHRGVIEAVRFVCSLSDQVTAVYIEIQPGDAARVSREWEKYGLGIPLSVVPSPYRSIIRPLMDFLDQTDRQHDDGQLAVVILPQFIPARWWQYPMHNQTAWLIKLALLYGRRRSGRGRAIMDIPFYLRE